MSVLKSIALGFIGTLLQENLDHLLKIHTSLLSWPKSPQLLTIGSQAQKQDEQSRGLLEPA